jgi:ATP-dependent Clp protease ATP-binding subunit ClpC
MFRWNYPLTRNCQDALDEAVHLASDRNSVDIGTEHLLYGIVRIDCVASRLLKAAGMTLDDIRSSIPPNGHEEDEVKIRPSRLTPAAQEAMESALDYSRKGKKDRIGSEHILMALLENRFCMGFGIMRKCGIDVMKISTDILVSMGYDARLFNEDDGGSSDPVLFQYSRDLIDEAVKLSPVIGRQAEMNRVMQTLSRRMKNNPCLIGEPGVGKTAVVEGLAQRIAQGRVPDYLKDKRILRLDLSGMVAGSKYRGDFEEKMKRVIREAASDRSIILFVDEIHTLIGAGGSEGSLDAANILKPALSRGEVQLIGATTVDEYRKHIEKDAALERRFQPIMIEEPGEAQTEEILMGIRPGYEAYHGLTITDGAVKAAVSLSTRYISDRFRPDKSIDLLDEACAGVKLRRDKKHLRPSKAEDEDPQLVLERLIKEQEDAIRNEDMPEVSRLQAEITKLRTRLKRRTARKATAAASSIEVTEDDVARVAAEMTGIPVQRLAESDNIRLRGLEKLIGRRVVGQREAVSAVAKAVRRGRVGLKDPHRPIGSFLFLGPTGVGKTELSKALAEALFGKEDAMIRIDMSEYMEKHSVSKIIGSPPGYVGYDEGGQLSEKVRRNPYSVILFDEIEKAHPDVFHILLQVLDDGHITDSQGRRVDFKNTIIIMTSNAGAQRIVEPKNLGFGKTNDVKADYETMKSHVMEEVKRLFRPEFLNRIDDILVFHPLSRDDMVSILDIMLKQLNARTKEAMGISITMSHKAKERMIGLGYSDKYGARPLRRALQTEIEDKLTDEVLMGNIKSGDHVSIREKEGSFIFAAS